MDKVKELVEWVASKIIMECGYSNEFPCPYKTKGRECQHENKEICPWMLSQAKYILSHPDLALIVNKGNFAATDNNMGNMNEEQAIEFFEGVKDTLSLDIEIGFTDAGSICIDKSILIDYRDLNYPWATKSLILHEITHYLVPSDHKHGLEFHRKYAQLVSKFMANYDVIPLSEAIKEMEWGGFKPS